MNFTVWKFLKVFLPLTSRVPYNQSSKTKALVTTQWTLDTMSNLLAFIKLFSHFRSHIPPKATWSTAQIPDLSGKVMIVTGGNTGIGKDTIEALLEHNAKVYMASRNSEKAMAAIEDLKTKTGKEALFLKLDLADLKSVKAAAEEFMSKEKELHVLFNNGGVMFCPMEMVTAQGYDLQFGTNVLAKTTATPVRVVNTSSVTHVMFRKLDFNSFKDGPTRKKLGKYLLYGQSKFGNIVFSNELVRRYGEKGIASTSLHPGDLKTELNRHSPIESFINFFLYPSKMGALTQLWAGTAPEPEGKELSGKYLVPWARLGAPVRAAEDEKLGKELWEWCEEQVKDF
ncbi:hypothetical protein D9758_015640 [Tetrapyrgos nigripes]|uniref:NAD(P)-binding protein n=1 Tax=Tetrapyrgos nigripes TaxID=182062 RepID=A0A8H5CKP7_9AGAR|nr:hypothetical protein D9758_015640 [Tetrapyrgos nigripes]